MIRKLNKVDLKMMNFIADLTKKVLLSDPSGDEPQLEIGIDMDDDMYVSTISYIEPTVQLYIQQREDGNYEVGTRVWNNEELRFETYGEVVMKDELEDRAFDVALSTIHYVGEYHNNEREVILFN